MISKKYFLLVSGVASIVALLLSQVNTQRVCERFSGFCPNALSDVFLIMALFFPLFILAISMSLAREETFTFWAKCASIWLPLCAIFTFLTRSDNQTSSFIPPLITTQGTVVLGMILLLTVITVLIAIFKPRSLHKAGR